MILGAELIRQTVNFYFKNKKELLYISAGLLFAPANYFWYILFPYMYFKICLAIVLFGCIMFVTKGVLQLTYNSIRNNDSNKAVKIVLGIIAEIVTIISSVLTII